MRDVKLSLLLAAPAALTVLGLIWFLRRKSNKDSDGGTKKRGKDPSVVKSRKEDNQMVSKPTCVEEEGITLRQRKIPETSARERGSSDLQNVMTISSKPSMGSKDTQADGAKLTNSEKEKVKEIVEAAIDAGLKQAKEQFLEKRHDGNAEVHEDMMGGTVVPVHLSTNNNNGSSEKEIVDPNVMLAKSEIKNMCVPVEEMAIEVKEEIMQATMPTLNSSPHSTPQATINFSSQLSSSPTKAERKSVPLEYTPVLAQSGNSSTLISPSDKTSTTDSGLDESTTSDSKSDQVDGSLSQTSCSSKLCDSAESVSEVDSKVSHSSVGQQGNKTDDSSANSSSPVCDSNSVGSSDSGRGGSEQDGSCQNTEALIHYDFNMPSELCGRLIGRQGRNINHIKTQSGASVSLTNNPLSAEFQICQVVGSQSEVDEALNMIRRKFPLADNPRLTMTPIPLTLPKQLEPAAGAVLVPDNMQMSLPDGASVEVYVSTIVDAGHVFVQQPTHRSFMSLEKINYLLNLVYSQDESIPSLPTPVECGVICVCENEGSWYRAMVMSPEDEFGECQVKFVDYGGYTQLPISCIKQIRADFMNLPFQAVECFVANISPLQDEDYFSPEATMALSEMSQMKVLQCQVVARNELGTPYIHLYQVNVDTNTATMVNRALVNQGLVRWMEIV